MANENEEVKTPKEEPIKTSQSDMAFEKLSAIEPERGEELLDEDEGDGGGHKSLTERMEESPNLSDIQTLDKGMFPDLGYKHLNVLQVSMITPEKFLPYLSMLTKDLISNHDELSVTEALVYSDTALSIGFDREGRIDKLALGGAAKDAELEKEEKKGLGGLG